MPQIERMRDLLSRGIGVHHGGLLPIVKEVRNGFFFHLLSRWRLQSLPHLGLLTFLCGARGLSFCGHMSVEP